MSAHYFLMHAKRPNANKWYQVMKKRQNVSVRMYGERNGRWNKTTATEINYREATDVPQGQELRHPNDTCI